MSDGTRFYSGRDEEDDNEATIIEAPDQTFEMVGPGHLTVYDRADEDDEYVPLIAIHCPNCGTFVAELPEDEVGQLECPNCDEEFDLG